MRSASTENSLSEFFIFGSKKANLFHCWAPNLWTASFYVKHRASAKFPNAQQSEELRKWVDCFCVKKRSAHFQCKDTEDDCKNKRNFQSSNWSRSCDMRTIMPLSPLHVAALPCSSLCTRMLLQWQLILDPIGAFFFPPPEELKWVMLLNDWAWTSRKSWLDWRHRAFRSTPGWTRRSLGIRSGNRCREQEASDEVTWRGERP